MSTIIIRFCITLPIIYYYYYSVKWVQIDGIEYRKPCILITSVKDDDDPVFGLLENIYVVCQRCTSKCVYSPP